MPWNVSGFCPQTLAFVPFVKMFCHSLPYVLPPATKDGRRACRAKQGAEYHLIFSTLPPLMQNQITHPVEAIDGFSLSRQNLWHDTARHFDNPQQVLMLEGQTCSLGTAFTRW